MAQGLMFTSVGCGLYECISGINKYNVDLQTKTCTCKGFYYGQSKDDLGNKVCKHLRALGVKKTLSKQLLKKYDKKCVVCGKICTGRHCRQCFSQGKARRLSYHKKQVV